MSLALPTYKPASDGFAACGLLLRICDMAKIKIIQTTANEEEQKSVVTVLAGLKNQLEGFLTFMLQTEVKPLERVPKAIRAGWDFGLYNVVNYALEGMTFPYMFKISKRTTIGPKAGEAPWAHKGTIPTLTRVDNVLRFASKTMCSKLCQMSAYLKDVSWVRSQVCGKKPVGGIYHDDELQIMIKDHDNRVKKFDEDWAVLKDVSLSDSLQRKEVNNHMSKMAKTSHSSEAKRIIECANRRIPLLIVKSRSRKSKETTIISGSSLPEKISNAGITSIRDIVKVLWSPLMDPLKVGDCIGIVSSVLHSEYKEESSHSLLNSYVHNLEDSGSDTAVAARKNLSFLSIMVSVAEENSPRLPVNRR
jgi:hypothetical protein